MVMRKHIIISTIATIVIIALAVGFLLFSFLSPKVNISGRNAILNYVYNDKKININLNAQESRIIKDMFNNKRLYKDNPSCGFSENVSISFGKTTFCIACDSCPIVKLEDKYFKISKQDRKILNKIFGEYGAFFPCV